MEKRQRSVSKDNHRMSLNNYFKNPIEIEKKVKNADTKAKEETKTNEKEKSKSSI